ncbi:GntR family transcriptional regulator [Spinactinospora alkalitolerans]|uniref:GntR family transcriptional regulator n=1 Tax=Spinactinospora alkalitolerans TaxID=687207 RepID=A0A852U022_9ACTN|nr:GntR family transcriptional regulator [Spinactinospora alkalitolerans]NYE49599.1 GntR family transcriptional regulator [Spinactinospora alkalitolerans]
MAEQPLYVQLADELRQNISSGEWGPGHKLPPERELAEDRKISRNTVIKAYDLLLHEGLITSGNTRAGRRVRDRRTLYVYASKTEQVDRRITSGVDAWVTDVAEQNRSAGQVIDVGVVNADEDLADWLQVPVGEPVAVRRRLRSVDGLPDNLCDTYYPMDLAREIPEILNPADVQQGVIALMAERGYRQVRYEDRLRWSPATPDEAAKLGLGPGIAVLRQIRIGHTEERPVKATVTIWPGDTHELRYEMSA